MLISLLPFLPRMVLLLYVWKKSNCTISRCWVTCSFVLPQGRIGQLAWDSAFCLKRYNPVALGLVQILVTGKNVDLWIWYLWYQLVWWARFDLPRNDFFLGMFNVEFQQKFQGPFNEILSSSQSTNREVRSPKQSGFLSQLKDDVQHHFTHKLHLAFCFS